MYLGEKVDVKENSIYNIDENLLTILLTDRTTGKNILWATNMYESHGLNYSSSSQMTVEQITGRNGQVIKPRTKKSKQEQVKRIRDKGEVFTPSWVCNRQNNVADSSWFGMENIFNKEEGNTWLTNKNKILFPKGKTWVDYVKSKRLEIACGEAPYLVSRYDTVTGEVIPPFDRIGLLDRKLRVISENVDTKDDWKKYAIEAYKSIYGYEWQGDSLLIARENMLYTYIDYYLFEFNENPSIDDLTKIAEIISWNVFQMDGIKYVIPNSCKNERFVELTLFGENVIEKCCDGCKSNKLKKHNGIYCKTMNWDTNKPVKFINLLKKGIK